MQAVEGERCLYAPLIAWVKRLGWARPDSIIVEEVPLHGRSVDIAILTRTGRTTSFEVKLADARRGIEQAFYNQHAFDRSYVVLGRPPTAANLALAGTDGVGIILVTGDRVRVAQSARQSIPVPEARSRAIDSIVSRDARGRLHV